MDNLFILVTALEHAVEAKVVLFAVAKGTGEVRGGRLGSLVALRVGVIWWGRGRGHDSLCALRCWHDSIPQRIKTQIN